VLRQQRHWSQAELAQHAEGLNKETINRLELGANVRLDTVYKVADALGVEPQRLLHDDDELAPRRSTKRDEAEPVAPSADESRVAALERRIAQYEAIIREIQDVGGRLIELAVRGEETKEQDERAAGPARHRRRA